MSGEMKVENDQESRLPHLHWKMLCAPTTLNRYLSPLTTSNSLRSDRLSCRPSYCVLECVEVSVRMIPPVC